MAREVFSIIGSGTTHYTRGILPAAQRGTESTGEGIRGGTQVILANPEDLLSVDAFAMSGVTVGTATAIEILGPHINPLPRMRQATIQNISANPVYIGHKGTDLPLEGFQIPGTGSTNENVVTLPILHNVSVWALATGGPANVRILIL